MLYGRSLDIHFEYSSEHIPLLCTPVSCRLGAENKELKFSCLCSRPGPVLVTWACLLQEDPPLQKRPRETTTTTVMAQRLRGAPYSLWFPWENESHSVESDSLWPHGLYNPWNSSGRNTGVGNLSLLQGIFPTQGSNPGLPHCRQILDQLSHQGSPRILKWVAYSFSSRSSRPRNWTKVSCTAGRFFTNWAMLQ